MGRSSQMGARLGCIQKRTLIHGVNATEAVIAGIWGRY
jgi:hypothetical protein